VLDVHGRLCDTVTGLEDPDGPHGRPHPARVAGARTGDLPPAVDRLFAPEEMELLLKDSDFVIVVLPLTDQTKGLLGRRAFEAMRGSALLINLSRGPVVDEHALLQAVREKQIGGAVLDVFCEEPLPKDHPFWLEPGIIVTPHIAGASPQYMKRALEIARENIVRYAEGGASRLTNRIPLGRGY
jgi:phosphoglycerate dehydrogenase-like enzyme